MERILDEFADFDDPPPIERDEPVSALRLRAGKRRLAKLLKAAQESNRGLKGRQRFARGRGTVRTITLATKA